MKIGLFLTGHMRSHVPFWQNYAWLLNEDHEVDVYVATWNLKDNRKEPDNGMYVDGTITEEYLYSYFSDYLRSSWVGNLDEFEQHRPIRFERSNKENDVFGDDNISNTRAGSAHALFHMNGCGIIQRIIDIWTVVNKAYTLCSSDVYNQYDLVIRTRPDIRFETPVALNTVGDAIYVDAGFGFIDGSPETGPFAVSDRIAWGKPHFMRKYFETCFHIMPMYQTLNLDIGYAEHMLATYLSRWSYFSNDVPDVPVIVDASVKYTLSDGRK